MLLPPAGKPDAPSRRAAAGWAALGLGGLTLGLIALASPWHGPEGGAPAAVLTVHLPGSLVDAVLALTALAVLLLLVLLFPHHLRRRRKGDEEFELYQEPRKVSPGVLVLLILVALVPVAILVAIVRTDWSPLESGVVAVPGGHAPSPSPASPPGSPAPLRPPVSLPGFSGAVGGLALVAAVASVALMLWIFLADRLAAWWYGPLGDVPAPEPLLEAVEVSLDDLRRDPDTRRAIILCYRRFEQALGGAGVPRSPWETPTEFMRSVLARLPIPFRAVRRLTALFERARFSEHSLTPRDRDEAVDALVEIRGALERIAAHAAAP
jgi:hypothetical protein